MQRNGRHLKLLELINNEKVETQDEIAAALNSSGYKVTQATISRDIKDLGLIKISDGGGRQYYTTKALSSRLSNEKINDISRSIITTTAIKNQLIVVKTMEGFGKAAKKSIEHLGDYLGCVADDNSIFIAFKDSESAKTFYKKLNELIY